MKPLLILILMMSSISLACEHPDYHSAEASWVFEEVFQMECLSKNPAVDGKAISKLCDSLAKRFPNVVFEVQTLNIRIDVQERKNTDKAPITTLQAGGHGTYNPLVRY